MSESNIPDEAQGASPFPSAFRSDFLDRLYLEEDPPTALDAEVAGPWTVHELPAGDFGLFRYWESPFSGDRPHARFRDRSSAWLAAAVLPTLQGDAMVRIDPEANSAGHFTLYQGREPVGSLPIFDEPLVAALNVAADLVRNPEGLALLLRAAGPTALELLGRRLSRWLPGPETSGS